MEGEIELYCPICLNKAKALAPFPGHWTYRCLAHTQHTFDISMTLMYALSAADTVGWTKGVVS
jgi:hypothetical protein